jgi:hypothetical protein
MSGRAAFRSYTHAAKGFDCEFEQHLAARITEVIALESRVDDVAAIVLRRSVPSLTSRASFAALSSSSPSASAATPRAPMPRAWAIGSAMLLNRRLHDIIPAVSPTSQASQL